ncbi:isochorismate synthase [Arthrobacter mobilis]|uniref:isochorismate synthase n=1 Tax=Arthrobacter mobilis TaxID=2724944 RepID=A0A7X6HAI7_9MICC|nr:isochorismate synthase [Arthrobacter mobilis]NKX53476.1 isochorismate synthase [Arthrobacter mobilis]
MPDTLRGITIPWAALPDTAGLLEYLVRDDVLCWVRRDGGLAGFGEAARFTATGPERFRAASAWWRTVATGARIENHVGGPGTGAVAFGSFAFSWTSRHASRLIIPSVLVGLDGGRGWLTYLTCDPDAEVSAAAAEAALAGWLEGVAAGRAADDGDRLVPGQVSEEDYRAAVTAGVERIARGELSKLVLARDVVAELASPVATAQVLRELAVRYQDCWTYAVDGLVGSTPEMLIKVDNNVARARVLAGTLDRANIRKRDGESDADYAQRVLAGSEKQQHEHEIAIDSLTAKLEPYTSAMTSHSEPFVLQLPNVWHLASDVTAELGRGGGPVPSSLELAEAVHPTAAVCGSPTELAGALIRELEGMDRGPYAGPVGWTDGAGNGEWGIALRGAVVESPTRVRLYAGCGIVEASTPEAELAETWAKFRPMLEALGLRG